jgi:chromosome segregation ATPase
MDAMSNAMDDDIMSGAGPDPGIVFDTGSGISEAEQRGILEGIENAVRQDRRALTADRPARAKKRALFPLLVNAAALLFLAAALLLFMRSREEERAGTRRGAALYNSTERALIREIRQETARELDAKDAEIGDFLAKLAGVDHELRELHSNNQELTAEQKVVEANLRRLQEEYTASISSLENERSRILEESRAREAGLKAQLDERAQEMAAQAERSRATLSSAQREIDRLSGDQEKGAAIEAQLSGLYIRAASAINGGSLGEAAATLTAMRDFINTPAFQGIHSLQPRRGYYLSSISTLEGLIGLAEKLNSAVAASGGDYGRALAELEERNAALEEQVAGLNEAVAASGAEGSGLGRQVGELQSRISALQTQSAQQGRSLDEQRKAAEEQQRRNAELASRNTELDQQISRLRQNLEEQQRGNTELTARNSELAARNAGLDQQLTVSRQTAAERDTEINRLRTQNTEKDASIQALNSQLAAIRQLLQNNPE